jgi:hypothetical protein
MCFPSWQAQAVPPGGADVWPLGGRCVCPLHVHRLLGYNKLTGKVPSKWIPFLQGLYYWCLAAGCACVAALHVARQACFAFALSGFFVSHKSLPCVHGRLAAALLVGLRSVCRCDHACMLRLLRACHTHLSFSHMALLPSKRVAAFACILGSPAAVTRMASQSACAVLCSLSSQAQTADGADV